MQETLNAPQERRFWRAMLAMLSGPLVGTLYFAFAYGAHTALCIDGRAEARAALPLMLVFGGVMALAALGVMAISIRSAYLPPERRLELVVAVALTAFAALSILFIAASALLISPCDALR